MNDFRFNSISDVTQINRTLRESSTFSIIWATPRITSCGRKHSEEEEWWRSRYECCRWRSHSKDKDQVTSDLRPCTGPQPPCYITSVHPLFGSRWSSSAGSSGATNMPTCAEVRKASEEDLHFSCWGAFKSRSCIIISVGDRRCAGGSVLSGVHYLHLTGQRGRGGGRKRDSRWPAGGRATPVCAKTPLRGVGVSSMVHPPL